MFLEIGSFRFLSMVRYDGVNGRSICEMLETYLDFLAVVPFR